jgi:hypothetical protein
MQSPAQQADHAEVVKFLRTITDGWAEIADEQPQLELRCIGLNGSISVARFSHTAVEDAAHHAVEMNQHHQNVYACVNPVSPAADRRGARDADILAAFFCFADADSTDSMANVTAFAGPKFTMSVRTGTVPYLRGHAYWRLEEPVRNLDAWRQVQRDIAARLQTDSTVVNPSRIMRVAGTMSWPPERKRMKGYVPELVTMRTDFSTDRDPVPFERMMRAFPADSAAPGTSTGQGVQIDLGQQAMDRALAEADILAGKNWHHNVVRLVGSYVSRGLTDAEIHALTDRFTMAGYTVEDTRREVQTAIDGARAKGWTPAPDPAAERMAAQIPEQAAGAAESAADGQVGQAWPTPVQAFNAALLPRRRWVYDNVYIRSYLTVTASAGGIGKTSLALAEAIAIATGKPILQRPVREQTNTWVINLEDPRAEMNLRLASLMQHYQISHADLAGRLYIDGEDDIQITLAAEGRDGVITNDALLELMATKIREHKIGCVIIDPFVSTHAVNENSNVQVQIVVAMLRKLARDTDCAVHLIHHVRKGNGDDATVDSIRGANALIGAARAARVINRVTVDDAMRLGIEEDDATGLFRIDDAKANLAAPADKALHMRTIGVEIANGEWIGTVVPITLPDLFDGITAQQTMQVQRVVAEAERNNEPLRDNVQAKQWVGHAIGEVLDIDTTEKHGKARVSGMVKQWVKTGILKVERMYDRKHSREIGTVVVGKMITREEAGL